MPSYLYTPLTVMSSPIQKATLKSVDIMMIIISVSNQHTQLLRLILHYPLSSTVLSSPIYRTTLKSVDITTNDYSLISLKAEVLHLILHYSFVPVMQHPSRPSTENWGRKDGD